jgi:uncharacterized membrane protein
MMSLEEYITITARILEAIGVGVITLGVLISLILYSYHATIKRDDSYKMVRRKIGKAILLGLEILVAADIIATVVTEPNLKSIVILGIIILIRILLSFSLQIELEGKLPWQPKREETHKL